MSKTLSDYIPLLKPVQQDFIVRVVQEYTDRGKEFHRGLLPFLPAEEAADCLQLHLEVLRDKISKENNDAERAPSVIGEKFIKQTISVFRGALIYKANEDEMSEVLSLDTKKLKQRYKYRFNKKFHISLGELGVNLKSQIKGMIELQMVGRNRWKVTCHHNYSAGVCSHLMDEFAHYGYTGV